MLLSEILYKIMFSFNLKLYKLLLSEILYMFFYNSLYKSPVAKDNSNLYKLLLSEILYMFSYNSLYNYFSI